MFDTSPAARGSRLCRAGTPWRPFYGPAIPVSWHTEHCGKTGQPHLYVHDTDWFGVINGRRAFALDRIYYRWIHTYRYGRNC
jgi:hypothetical protein